MSDTTTQPEWLEVGAQVICWTTGGAGVSPGYRLGTVKKVNRTTFRVETDARPGADEPLFPIEDDGAGRHSKRGPGAWATTRHAAHRASRIGRIIEAKMRTAGAVNWATDAVVDWQRDKHDLAALDKAVAALLGLRQQLDRGHDPQEASTDE